MEFINFPEANLTLAEDQPEYQTLYVNYNPNAEGFPMTFCVQLSPEDLENAKNNDGKIFISQFTNGKAFAPMNVWVQMPDYIQSDLSREQLADLLQRAQNLRDIYARNLKALEDIESEFNENKGPQEHNLN